MGELLQVTRTPEETPSHLSRGGVFFCPNAGRREHRQSPPRTTWEKPPTTGANPHYRRAHPCATISRMMGETEQVKLSDLTPHPRNVRQGDVGAISESLKAHGQYRPIVAQRSTGHILAGNHTYKAAKALKWKTIEVTWLDVDDEQALRILLVDNRANDLATYDEHALTDLLKTLMETETQLAGTGFDPSDLQQVIEDINFTPLDDAEMPRLDQRAAQRCPDCGFEWRVGKKGEIEPV